MVVGEMTKIDIFSRRGLKVLIFQFTQLYSIMYEDHLDGLVSLLNVYNKR